MLTLLYIFLIKMKHLGHFPSHSAYTESKGITVSAMFPRINALYLYNLTKGAPGPFPGIIITLGHDPSSKPFLHCSISL